MDSAQIHFIIILGGVGEIVGEDDGGDGGDDDNFVCGVKKVLAGVAKTL